MVYTVHLELYEAFVAVAETGGFTSAAQHLNRTQATVSQQIKRLETVLGRALFARTSRSVQVTTAGEAVLPYARQILHLHGEAAHVASGAAAFPLRLGVPDQYADAVIPGFLEVLSQKAASPPPTVVCDQSKELFEQFVEGELDIILTSRYPAFPVGRTVARDDLVWMGRPDFTLQPETPVPLILYPNGCPFRERALAALQYHEIPWTVVYTGQSRAALHTPLTLGLGITVMSRRAIDPDLTDVGPATGLPAICPAELDLHLNARALERYGADLEEALIDVVTDRLVWGDG